MRYELLAVYDLKAESFNRPMYAPSVNYGSRSFIDEVNRASPDNVLNQHPEDFLFYHLGSWDDATGKHELLDTPVVVLHAVNIVR